MKNRILLAAAAVMLVLGLVAAWQSWQLHSSPAASNHALTDATRTAEVQQSVSKALTSVLSYDHANPSATEQAAEQWLVDDAHDEYETLYASLAERAPGQKLTLTAVVQTVGVKELDDNSATALVFLDQSSQRASDDEASVSAAQLSVDVVKRDGVWKVSGLTPL